jgi:hypothetical protein
MSATLLGVADDSAADPWAALGERFVGGQLDVRGRVRTHVIHEHLRAVMAMRPALAGDWAAALAAFDRDREVNGLGVETRGDGVDALSGSLRERGVDQLAWYGVRLFTDGWAPDRPATDPEDLVLAVELEATRRDPYRRLSRLFHLVGRR